MNHSILILSLGLLSTFGVRAQDWPQWRGADRQAHAADFKPPKTWPKELTQKWKVTVGEGVATPALVGDRLYVFSRQEGFEVIRCLSAADGKEVWQDKYESLGAVGPSQSFSGPRSSPAVGDGKVVTVGVRGMISALDAATGAKVWRKDDFHAYPTFYSASSPFILEGLVIVQAGGKDNGALVAYNLTSGDEKWKWSGPSPAYASPVLMTVGGSKLILAQTESKVVAVNAGDGTLVWDSTQGSAGAAPGGPGGGGGRDYRASSPVIDGQTFYLAGRGVKAMRLEKQGDTVVGRELWNNAEKAVQFNTPVLKDGKLYALATDNGLFCLDAKDGKTLWSAPFPSPAPAGESPRAELGIDPAIFSASPTVFAQAPPGEPGRPERPAGPPGGGRRRGGMGGGGTGFGSLVDAGAVVLGLTPGGLLVVLDPTATEFKQLASYKVADGQTYAYPVASGNRLFIIRDKESLILWTVD